MGYNNKDIDISKSLVLMVSQYFLNA